MGYFTGVVRDVWEDHEIRILVNICYEDEDSEDMSLEEMKRILVNGIIKVRGELVVLTRIKEVTCNRLLSQKRVEIKT